MNKFYLKPLFILLLIIPVFIVIGQTKTFWPTLDNCQGYSLISEICIQGEAHPSCLVGGGKIHVYCNNYETNKPKIVVLANKIAYQCARFLEEYKDALKLLAKEGQSCGNDNDCRLGLICENDKCQSGCRPAILEEDAFNISIDLNSRLCKTGYVCNPIYNRQTDKYEYGKCLSGDCIRDNDCLIGQNCSTTIIDNEKFPANTCVYADADGLPTLRRGAPCDFHNDRCGQGLACLSVIVNIPFAPSLNKGICALGCKDDSDCSRLTTVGKTDLPFSYYCDEKDHKCYPPAIKSETEEKKPTGFKDIPPPLNLLDFLKKLKTK
jgi:hypothetical protein